MKAFSFGISLSLLLGVCTTLSAAEFPSREVNMIVSVGPGSSTDIAARILALGMQKELGKTVVVTNRPGALGTMGVSWLAKQKPDPHQVGVITYASQAYTPHLLSVGYTMDDFTWICGFGRYRYSVAVRADSPYKTMKDLVSAAQRNSVFIGASAIPNVMPLLQIGRSNNARFELVTYKSGQEVVTALVSGQVEVVVQNPPETLPHVRSGKLRLLASASPVRWPEAPDVPTLKEAGYDFVADSWMGLGIRAGAPASDVQRLETACLSAIRSDDISKRIEATGSEPIGLTGEQYLHVLREGYESVGKAIKELNIPRVGN